MFRLGMEKYIYHGRGKKSYMVMRFGGNVGVCREILEFEGKSYLFVHKNNKIVGKLASSAGNKNFFPALIFTSMQIGNKISTPDAFCL